MDLEKQKEEVGKLKSRYSSQSLSLSVGAGSLSLEIFGPPEFLSAMPSLFNKVNHNLAHGHPILLALKKSNKPISVIYESDRFKLGAGAITENQWFTPWWNIYSIKLHELVVMFHHLGYSGALQFECLGPQGKRSARKVHNEDAKFALMHELFHLWQAVEPSRTPKIGKLHRNINDPQTQKEIFATRYVNQWRFSEGHCIRSIYGFTKVDTIANYD